MRLIDADELRKKIEEEVLNLEEKNSFISTYMHSALLWVISLINRATTIESEPVRHGEWIPVHKHIWKKDDNGKIDEWSWDYEFHNGPECELCHATPCVHCYPDWQTSECSKTLYECSRCQTHVKDMAIYCPNCGAKIDKKSLENHKKYQEEETNKKAFK